LKFSNLPEELSNYWDSLPREDQRELLACLGRNLKKQIFFLRAKAEVKEVAPILAYIQKHRIKYEANRVEDHIIFSFQGAEDRNAVQIGRHCL